MINFLFVIGCSSQSVSSDQDNSTTQPTSNSPNRRNQLGGQPMHQPKKGSGGMFQDPSGFPAFHNSPAPGGPPVTQRGNWSAPQQLTQKPTGGYRPQIAISPSGKMHVVYYDRLKTGDIIRHRYSDDGKTWSKPVQVGHDSERNWGPDLVARADESVVLVYDHALADFSSQGFLTTWRNGVWDAPTPLTPDGKREIGSGHVANANGEDLAYVYIGKQLGEKYRFVAHWRWYTNGSWQAPIELSLGKADAWHTNVERRPDGSVLAGYDIGTGGSETTLYIVEGRDGQLGEIENLTANGKPGERPHFAFAPDGTDYITWFHKENGMPKHVYVRAGKPGKWGAIAEPSKGYGGFHFDPEIAINKDGVLCLVWGWDANQRAELIYSINKGEGWTKPRKVADINWGKPGLSSIDVDASGRFHVVWNQGVRGYNEVYYAQLEVK